MQFNLQLKPAVLEYVAKPGTGFTQAFEVENASSQPVLLTTSVAPWLPQAEDGSVTYTNVPPHPDFSFSLANADLRLGQTFILRPDEKRQLVLKVKSSPSTPLSDAYFTFFVSQDPGNTPITDGNHSAVTGRIGSHLLISTANTATPETSLAVSQFFSSPRLADTFLTPIRFQGLLENTSPHYFRPSGKLVVTKNGQEFKKIELFPQNVLAQHSRTILCQQDNQPVPCLLHPPFWPGIYTATLTLDSSPQNDTVSSATYSFFVFPFSPLALIITLGLFFYLLRRRPRH